MHVEIVGTISDIETIATGPSVRIRALLRKRYGDGDGESSKALPGASL